MQYIEDLNHDNVDVRLDSLKQLMEMIKKGEIQKPEQCGAVNNHIHTTYSFSPYSPTKALWMAYNSGLITAGIMDHDSIGGAEEFIKAGEIIGIATTIGVECRADLSKTPLNGKRINNPDQKSVAYMALHGIPHTKVAQVKEFFSPFMKERNNRNKKMVDRLNEILKQYNITLDFENDVVPLSKMKEGGSITERHLLYALSKKFIKVFGKGENLVDFIKNKLNLQIGSKVKQHLLDVNNPYYEYDLLGALKSDMVSAFYIHAKEECPYASDVIALSKKIGAISAYAYLGDVGDSVTGDKKTQKFEDDYLELLFGTIKNLGFNAVTYMPSRNSLEQLKRLKDFCDVYSFFQISGEDINSPRQSFICEALKNEEFSNLIHSTWALIGHEIAGTKDVDNGMFSAKVLAETPDLGQRIEKYEKIAIDKYRT